MPIPCSRYSVSVLDGDQVYVVGARDDGKDVLHFDTASGVWSTLGSTSNDKYRSAGWMSLCGRWGWCLNSSTHVERYDVATDTLTAVAHMLEGRNSLCTVTIGSADTAEEQDLFDSLIAKAGKERM
jgi:hypothetical protein